jgi:hypothetical protein
VNGPEPGICRGGRCVSRFWFEAIARAPNPELELVASTGSQKRQLRMPMPLRPGGIWLAPGALESKELRLRSATPKTHAYLSLLGEHGRRWGAIVPLTEGEQGASSGRVALPDLEPGPWLALISSDPYEPPEHTAPWPLAPQLRAVEIAPLELLVDGVPAAVAAEEQRVRRVRIPVIGLIAAAAIAILLQIAVAGRRARRELERRIAADTDTSSAQAIARTPMAWAVVVAVALALAFAAMATIAALA